MTKYLIAITKELISCPSITPNEAGCFEIIKKYLIPLKFNIKIFKKNNTTNFYARYGKNDPHLTFVGHVDVVNPGNGWIYHPFTPTIKNNNLYGRGTVDMKGAISSFIEAIKIYFKENKNFFGSISILLTSDEEGTAKYGIKYMVPWLKKTKQVPNFFLIGEPTSEKIIGDNFKTGRRGSINNLLTIRGTQKHVAYSNLFNTPCNKLLKIIQLLIKENLDHGYMKFTESKLQITGLQTSTQVTNIIPKNAKGYMNIRFNPHYTGNKLKNWIKNICQKNTKNIEIQSQLSAEPFKSIKSSFHQKLFYAIQETNKNTPKNSLSGGTSDGRFLHTLSPMAELGLLRKTAHQINEHVHVQDLENLSRIYNCFINFFFL